MHDFLERLKQLAGGNFGDGPAIQPGRISDLRAGAIAERFRQLVPPPRRVPFGLRVRLYIGVLGYCGGLFAVFGLVFVFLFVINARVFEGFLLAGADGKATGTILEVYDTGASVGGSRNTRGTPVLGYRFSYPTVDGRIFEQVSYSAGEALKDGGQPLAVEDAVPVAYLTRDPSMARIAGLEYSLFPPFVLIVYLFPVLGVILCVVGYAKGKRRIRLLRDGLVTDCVVTAAEETNTKINNRRVWKYAYTFKDGMGIERTGTSRTTMTHRIGDEEFEPVIYLQESADPRNCELVDALPHRVMLDAQGNWQDTRGAKTWLALLLHAAVWAGMGLFFFLPFGRLAVAALSG